jgi:hypothetical protein
MSMLSLSLSRKITHDPMHPGQEPEQRLWSARGGGELWLMLMRARASLRDLP